MEVPPMHFLMIDGQGDPNTSPAYAEAVEALFALSYALKFAVRNGPLAVDYRVMPLEGLWWADDPASFHSRARSAWKWTMMVMQPDPVDAALVEQARSTVAARRSVAALGRVRFERFAEGPAAQTLHVGPFSEEGPTIQRVHDWIQETGARLAGKHHEIYLSDVRKADPARWKTVIRQPMR